MSHLSLIFPGHKWGTGREEEQLEHELLPIWYVGTAFGKLAKYATALAPYLCLLYYEKERNG